MALGESAIEQMKSPRIAGFYPEGRSDLDEAQDYTVVDVLPSGPAATSGSPQDDEVGKLEPMVPGPFYRAHLDKPVAAPEEDLKPDMLPSGALCISLTALRDLHAPCPPIIIIGSCQ